MPVTLTIKQVPEKVVETLRKRASANHRSMQGELMAILQNTLGSGRVTAAQGGADYAAHPKRGSAPAPGESGDIASSTPTRALTLRDLWESGKRQGLKSPGDSTADIRKLRDERNRG